MNGRARLIPGITSSLSYQSQVIDCSLLDQVSPSLIMAATPAASATTAAKGKQREKPLASLLAGTTAGAIEGFVTYPTEFAKTQLQFGQAGGAGAGAGVKVRGFPSYRAGVYP